jgi:hypothetical protein
MVEIYDDPHADAIREMARICAILVECGAPARDGELARSILDKLTEGTPLSGAERRALTQLRATYGGDPARGSGAAAAAGAIDPQEEEAQRWEDEGGAIGSPAPATDPPVEA